MMPRVTPRHIVIVLIAAVVIYGEYVVWFKSPIAQISAICDEFRALRDAMAGPDSGFRLIEEASAADFESARLINKAVRACDGPQEGVDVEESKVR